MDLGNRPAALRRLDGQPTNANTASNMRGRVDSQIITKVDLYQGTQKQMNYLWRQ
jgi:hypothetical protein